jgi:hypothetical protein
VKHAEKVDRLLLAAKCQKLVAPKIVCKRQAIECQMQTHYLATLDFCVALKKSDCRWWRTAVFVETRCKTRSGWRAKKYSTKALKNAQNVTHRTV